jgi:SUMO ligase MMS21 Smc5/6 complex component
MAEFSIEEFQVYFREIALEYKINDVEAYLDNVVSDIEFYSQNKEEKIGDFLPQKYQDKISEYFVLLHFSKYFLDGIMYARQINISLSRYTEIREVVFINGEKSIDSLEISKENTQQLENDYEVMKNLFIAFGQSLMGNKFSITDFTK